jgi:hypothetical protein
MQRGEKTILWAGLALGVAAAILLSGCSVQVSEGDKKVDVRTPIADVKVNAEVDVEETGLKVYPGARPLKDRKDEPQSAHVQVGSSFFGVKVIAATFETEDASGKVVDFYREQLKTYGEVTECRGEIDFKKSGIVCKPGRRGGDEIKLGAGDEGRHRIVAIKPKDGRTEFAVVYVQTRGEMETL